MNYIETELLRQRSLLARLLLGVPADAGAEEDPLPGQTAGEVGAVRQRLATGRSLPASAYGMPADAAPGGFQAPEAREAAPELTVRSRTESVPWTESVSRTDSVPRTESLPRTAEGLSSAAPVASSGGQRVIPEAGYAFGGTDGPIGRGTVLAVLPGGTTPSGELTAARTVSLWAERDARRYDGGYTMY